MCDAVLNIGTTSTKPMTAEALRDPVVEAIGLRSCGTACPELAECSLNEGILGRYVSRVTQQVHDDATPKRGLAF